VRAGAGLEVVDRAVEAVRQALESRAQRDEATGSEPEKVAEA